METWNAYTADGHLTDHTLTRGEPIPHGLYHLVVECIIRHRDGSTLFMKRDSAKLSTLTIMKRQQEARPCLGK